jgi:hypothetical protein
MKPFRTFCNLLRFVPEKCLSWNLLGGTMVKKCHFPKENSAGNILVYPVLVLLEQGSLPWFSNPIMVKYLYNSRTKKAMILSIKYLLPCYVFLKTNLNGPDFAFCFMVWNLGPGSCESILFRWGSVNYNPSENHTLEDLEVWICLITTLWLFNIAMENHHF